MCSEYSRCSKLLFFIFTNLLQIKEKTHVPVTVRFPDYAFNENTYVLFPQMGCCPDIPLLMADTKIN